ncbi:hypothetical protein ACFE04_025246 [Oxalis oulophora]
MKALICMVRWLTVVAKGESRRLKAKGSLGGPRGRLNLGEQEAFYFPQSLRVKDDSHGVRCSGVHGDSSQRYHRDIDALNCDTGSSSCRVSSFGDPAFSFSDLSGRFELGESSPRRLMTMPPLASDGSTDVVKGLLLKEFFRIAEESAQIVSRSARMVEVVAQSATLGTRNVESSQARGFPKSVLIRLKPLMAVVSDCVSFAALLG